MLRFSAMAFMWMVVTASASADDNDALQPRLKELLKRDAQSQTDTRFEKVLKFYKAGADVPTPEWLSRGFFQFELPTYDPRILAPYAEIEVRKVRMNLSPETKQLIESELDDALAEAVRLSQEDFADVARIAADVLMSYRDQLTAAHWKRILEGRQYIVRHRDSYPAGINARAEGNSMIPMGYVFLRGKDARSLKLDTEIYYDGKQRYSQGTPGSGWWSNLPYIGFGKVAIGKHRIQLKTTYDFKLGDIELSGTNISPEYEIEITAADTPDHLAAELDEALIDEVEAAVQVGSPDDARQFTYSQRVGDGAFKPIAKILVPAIKVTRPLPVSLCMKPEIYIEGEEKPLTRMMWRVPSGKTTKRVLENWVGDNRLRRLLQRRVMPGEDLKAKLVLRPSRADALTDTSVKKYYPKVIQREIVFRWAKPDAKQM